MLDITARNVSFSYEKELILGNISLDVQAGDFVCLLGKSGCGKSTLLRLLAGLEHPDSGELLVGGKSIEAAGLERGVVFQDYGLFPWMTVGQNITIALKQKFPSMGKRERKEEALHRLEEVGLGAEHFHKLPKELSGGMKQRCAIARAVAIDSPILLMDEPFGALDAVTRAKLQDLLSELWQKEKTKQKTIIFVTHDVEEALLLGSKIIVLGQSPSTVIFEHRFDKTYQKPERKQLYDNADMIALRNQLIKIINNEIEEKKQRD